MSTRPTEPGFYWWRLETYLPWEPVRVHDFSRVSLRLERTGFNAWYPLEGGIWGPRIPDPDEPRAEPTGGLTVAVVKHSLTTEIGVTAKEARAIRRALRDAEETHDNGELKEGDETQEDYEASVDRLITAELSATFEKMGFTRLTDAEMTTEQIRRGCLAATRMDAAGYSPDDCAAAFRRAVAEAREGGK